jgi:hypothetical protein
MSLPRDKAWFAAKKYGYGWGLPLRWQGWIVLLVYCVVIVAIGIGVAARSPISFVVCAGLVSGAFVAICFWKGEPAKWRWGETDGSPPKG